MKRIVINRRHGGFSLSDEGIELYGKLARLNLQKVKRHYYRNGIKDNDHSFWDRNIPRDCPHLVKVVTTLGSKACGRFAELAIVEIPADIEWEIEEYDGKEWIAEKHRTWR